MAISVENSQFSHHCILCSAEGVPLEFDIGVGQKNYNDGATWSREKFDDIFSRLDTIHERDRQTDRHRSPDVIKDRAYA